jgi:hypothetical protein
MRTKTKYREYRDGGRVNLPGQQELPIEKPEAASAAIEAPAPVAVENSPEQTQPQPEAKLDDAALVLQKQLDGLRKSEEIQRQQAAQALQPPVTREQKLALWKQQGMSEIEAAFFQKHPAMIDHVDITRHAAAQAMRAGLERGTDAHFDAVKKIFDENFARLQAQANPENPAMTHTPEFFKPPTPPAPPAAPTAASFVSAPVSREVPTSDRRHDLNPRSMTLTAEEVQVAKASGISVEAYARNKIKMLKEKSEGMHQ